MLTLSRDQRWLTLTLLICFATMLILDRPLIRGDGVAYLAWVDTFVLDGDIDFGNQLERLQPVNTYQIQWNERTGKLVNIFPFGVAIFQAPFHALGHLFAVNGWWDANPDYFHQMQGLWRPYSLWLMIGANVMGLVTLGFVWKMCQATLRYGRIHTTPPTASLLTIALFLGTPLIYYTTVSPLNSHNAGALALTVFIYLLISHQPPTTRYWLLLGLAAGLTILSRWQLALVVIPAWPILLWSQRWRGPIIAAIVAGGILLPLPLIWQAHFGQPFVIPYEEVSQGNTFLSIPQNTIGVFVQTIYHSPIILLSLLGLPFLWRQDRQWAIYALVVIGLQLWLNGGVLDWWAGETYGMRRMSELLPFYTLLLAILTYHAPRTKLLVVLSLLLSITYIIIFINYTWTNTDGVFINDPAIMLRHFINQPHRWQITWEVWRTHLGPLAWAMPGP